MELFVVLTTLIALLPETDAADNVIALEDVSGCWMNSGVCCCCRWCCDASMRLEPEAALSGKLISRVLVEALQYCVSRLDDEREELVMDPVM